MMMKASNGFKIDTIFFINHIVSYNEEIFVSSVILYDSSSFCLDYS